MVASVKNCCLLFLISLFSSTILSCYFQEFYFIKPFDFDYGFEDIFNKTGNNTFLSFIVSSGDYNMYLNMKIKDFQEYKNIYIKEISCKVDDASISLLKDRKYEIKYSSVTLGIIEDKDFKKLLKNIGKEKREILVIQEYNLDNGDLIHEEYIYLFEYMNRWVGLLDK